MVEITQKTTRLELEKERNLHLRKENRIRSIHSSLAIEKNSLTLEQVTDVINGKRVLGKPQEIKEVQNAYEAYEKIFTFNPWSETDFLAAHQLLMKSLIREEGSFRNGDVGIYDSDGNVVHVGARPQFVPDLIKEIFHWGETDDTPELIKSCVIHFEIEMIHPFSDGNGRMGRLWQNLILSKWQSVFEWIPVETIVCENQQQYYDMLAIGNKENESTRFIEFMLEVILKTLESFGTRKPINKLSDKTIDKISDKLIDKLSDNEKVFLNVIYDYLSEQNVIGNAKAVELSGKSAGTVRRHLVKFVDLGILKATGENRNRQYYLIKTNTKEKTD